MVSADSLNLDVLEVIFTYLFGRDLPAVALVSRAFLAGVIPRLYRTLAFRIHHAKRYPKIPSAFSAVLAHPHLATHVRNIDIRVAQTILGDMYPVFVRDCCRALELCTNLRSFVHTPDSVSSFLSILEEKSRLEDIRIHGRLTTPQAEKLLNLTKMQKIAIDFGSWNTMDILPRWAPLNRKTLTNLTLSMSNELNEQVLEVTLAELPQLLGLHVVGCPKVTHISIFRLVSHTPHLESLAFTAAEHSSSTELPIPALHHLQHIAIDTRLSITGSGQPPQVLPTILAHLKASMPPLSSFSLKAPELQTTSTLILVKDLLEAYDRTLKRVTFFDCSVGLDSIEAICKSCVHLEQLQFSLPIKQIDGLTKAMSHSKTLQALVDVDTHVAHEFRPNLKQDNVSSIMTRVPTLRRIVSNKRIWTGQRVRGALQISFDRQPTHGPSTHWFLPHD
ncbi:hypothetical protein BDZ94DRAFT_1223135 [Collybia nuda]|uniref:F-box domain-containing protein n=1 Tax=Collybia nuda TaxID=64659 RepID=A0A9P5Y140_9AGAR|nr:hypothetical protein BDZ94DRAFT_1223135 [Collybia nuda]